MQLAQFVRPSSWRPIDAQVRVSSVDQIVRLFGGALLYGRDPAVPLRELIQNGSDAVRARRKLTADPLYEGKVIVSLVEVDTTLWQLVVEDDGIGMSERVLAGPLLEFGKSFWGSEEAQDEFPGLVSARLDQGGRFGIGFFSTLMIAQRVEVTSHRWNAGEQLARKLTLREGLKLRPLISSVVSEPLGQLSTRAELYISSDDVKGLLRVSHRHEDGISVTLRQLVAHLCPTLDCDVWTHVGHEKFELEHPRNWHEIDALEWVRKINFGEQRIDEKIEEYLAKEAPFIEIIRDEDGVPCGRAAIAFGLFETGINAVSKLAATSRWINQFSKNYVGAIGYEPGGVRREIGPLMNAEGVRAWASSQAELLSNANINDAEKFVAAINIAEFGGDPTPVARVLLGRKIATLCEIFTLLADGNEIFVPLDRSSRPSIGTVIHWQTPHMGIGIDADELDFAVRVIEGWNAGTPDRVYNRIPTDEDPQPSCFIARLARYAEARGEDLETEPVKGALFGTYKGKESPRQDLS